ncbi:sodium-dependent bicarbonate transport family permease [Brevundimonas subvibrioides]|uniref:sodium-dependent bicarbonate transport family permease n=1 Tax=Brevundimonas subvibrioides TaxID=74313 RepID=UPI0022B4DBAE|nr:sodium-dependent bicarbonate transport family permease [Brevundimonas subvibrioides]
MPDLAASLELLTSPAILFFFVGAAAAFARSDLAIPEPVTKGLSLYLMLCIGFRGGVEARAAGFDGDFLLAGSMGLALSALMPVAAFVILFLLTRMRKTTRLTRPTLCALAATYGSVSVVTFAAGQQHLTSLGLAPGGYMAAVLALMETPAILTALMLMQGSGSDRPTDRGTMLREVLVGAATVMLLGSFLVGLISGEAGMKKLDLFVNPLFQGALCFFLLDLGLSAARSLISGGRRLPGTVIGFAIGFPLLSAALALGLARLAGLGVADGALLAILAGSASYIAVPAAMRVAAPKADPGVFVTASLAVTFPFNLTLGIALYAAAAVWLWS